MKTFPLMLPIALFITACGNAPAPMAPAPTADTITSAPPPETMVPSGLTSAERDSLLVDLITHIHRRPTAAINMDRTDLRFRAYYSAQLPLYGLIAHRSTPDGTQWYFLSRPASSVKGDRRGVAGRYRLGGDGRPTAFEEVLNTPVLSIDSIRLVADILFPAMIEQGGQVPYASDRRLVEWPDDHLYYDRELQEWRAVGAPKAP